MPSYFHECFEGWRGARAGTPASRHNVCDHVTESHPTRPTFERQALLKKGLALYACRSAK